MNKLISLFFAVIIFSYFFPIADAFAVSTPQFPLCNTPSGSVKSDFSSGIHGIAGKAGNFEGRDSVYQVNDNQLIQCYCPLNGNGIQTNWVKSSFFTSDEQKILLSEGWIFIPDGAAWGLTNESYLAKNSEFACNNSSVGGSSDSNSGSKSSLGSTGSVLGAATTKISELASTGNILSIYGFFALGIILITAGFKLSKKSE